MKWYKIAFATLLFCYSSNLLSQNKFLKPKFDFSVGSKLSMNQSEIPEFPRAFRINSSFLAAVDVNFEKIPFSIFYSYDYFIALQSSTSKQTNISSIYEKYTGHLLALKYKKANKYFGIGHYWQNAENWLNYLYPFGTTYTKSRYITGIIGFRNNKIEIEYQPSVRYSPSFGGVDFEVHSINTRILLNSDNIKNKNNAIDVRMYITGRLFILNQKPLIGEHFSALGFSPGIGLSILFPKINTNLFIERDIWLSLNGGSFERPIKGFISNSIIGLKYSFNIRKDKFIRIGLGMTYITDHSTLYDTRNSIVTGSINRRRWYYNVKGISATVEYPIGKRLNFEFRHITPFVGEKKFQSERTSIGVNYYFQ